MLRDQCKTPLSPAPFQKKCLWLLERLDGSQLAGWVGGRAQAAQSISPLPQEDLSCLSDFFSPCSSPNCILSPLPTMLAFSYKEIKVPSHKSPTKPLVKSARQIVFNAICSIAQNGFNSGCLQSTM